MELLLSRLAAAGSQSALAKELGISKPYLCDILKGNREIGPKVLTALGVRKVIVTTFQPIEDENG